MDSSATLNSVTLTGGANTIQPTILASQGTSNKLTIGNLVTSSLVTAGGTLNVQCGRRPARHQPGGADPHPIERGDSGGRCVPRREHHRNNGDYASYLAAQGIGAMGSVGFLAYGAALASAANTPTVINNNTAALVIGANTTTGSLKFGTSANLAITFTAGTEILTLATGGLLSSNNANTVTIGAAAQRGFLTAGTTAAAADLVTYQPQNTTTIESIIRDNTAGGAVRLIKSGGGALTLTAPNTYSGGTVVNQGTLNLTATTPGAVVIPGNLTINGISSATNTAVTMNTNAQQIAGDFQRHSE